MFCTGGFFSFTSKGENENKYDLRSRSQKNVLLLFSFIVLNMMKILVKTFMTYSFARV